MLSRGVGSCCVRFETGQTFNYLQTDATSPNIIGPTMLGVVAFVLGWCANSATTPNNVGPTMLGVAKSVCS